MVSLAQAIGAAGEHIEAKPVVSVYELIAQDAKAAREGLAVSVTETPVAPRDDDAAILARGPTHAGWQVARERYEAKLQAADADW